MLAKQIIEGLVDKLRPFDKTDKDTFGGTDFSDPEAQPLIGEIEGEKLHGTDMGQIEGGELDGTVIIVDKTGVSAVGLDRESFFPVPYAQGRGIAAQALRAKTWAELEKLGFTTRR